jgi:hypothetical protein
LDRTGKEAKSFAIALFFLYIPMYNVNTNSLSKKPRRVRSAHAANQFKSYFPRTCAGENIPLSLQTCPKGALQQAATPLSEKAKGLFRQTKSRNLSAGEFPALGGRNYDKNSCT